MSEPSSRLENFFGRRVVANHSAGQTLAKRRPVLRVVAMLAVAAAISASSPAMAKSPDDYRPSCERSVVADVKVTAPDGSVTRVPAPAMTDAEKAKKIEACIEDAQKQHRKGIWTGVGIVLFAIGYIYGQIQLGLSLSRAAERREKERRAAEEEARRRNPNQPPKPPEDKPKPPANGYDDDDDDDWPKHPPKDQRLSFRRFGRAA